METAAKAGGLESALLGSGCARFCLRLRIIVKKELQNAKYSLLHPRQFHFPRGSLQLQHFRENGQRTWRDRGRARYRPRGHGRCPHPLIGAQTIGTGAPSRRFLLAVCEMASGRMSPARGREKCFSFAGKQASLKRANARIDRSCRRPALPKL